MNKEKKKIIIGEDEKAIAHALQLKLTHEGFDVEIAGNGEEVLKEMEGKKFDLLLLDLVMPKQDGFAVLEELKERGNKVPVMVVSNLGQEEDRKRVESLGVKHYLIKSNTPITDMVSKVKQLLGVL